MASDVLHPHEGRASKRRRINSIVEHDFEGEQEGPACQSCRKRKAKCSRQQPCSNCTHISIDCIYEQRNKPGFRAGAVESLNRRLATLEQMFVGQGILLKPLLDRALQESSRTSEEAPFAEQLHKLKADYIRLAEPTAVTNQDANILAHGASDLSSSPLDSRSLPLQALDDIVDWYFDHIHPWIPMLHMQRFRASLKEQANKPRLKIILDAIVSLCLRFNPGGLDSVRQKDISLHCRNAVILQSMEKFSVESLQALVIVAFDIIGSGRGPSAWSVVGSMTRTVEQLRLSVEEEEGRILEGEYLIRRMSFLRQAESWPEVEERRRVFWNVFLMDRFCSIATGWNNSLTSADARRRLPCEGAFWQAGGPVRTPFFGIAGRSSNSQQVLTPSSERQCADEKELASIGGFAFCIEATENLNLVTSFFLQHPLTFHDVQEMHLWLMRFKELDLRLVKWRLFLPPKWRNASVLNQDGIMDPNLTLAHMTHNTAIIQLHQCIAYPAPQLRACPIALPSSTSSETCVAAATEIGTIAEQFLRQSRGITNPQFSFCQFIAGRVLLAHATYNAMPLHPIFETISTSLVDVGRRWAGGGDFTSAGSENLALRFSRRLAQAKQAALGAETTVDPTLDIRQPVYSDQNVRSRAASATPRPQPESVTFSSLGVLPEIPEHQSPDSISLAFPPLPFSFENINDFTIASGSEPIVPLSNERDFYKIFDDEYQKMLRVSTFAENSNGVETPGE